MFVNYIRQLMSYSCCICNKPLCEGEDMIGEISCELRGPDHETIFRTRNLHYCAIHYNEEEELLG